MAKKRFWMGSHGPYFFEDTKQVNDPDGVVTENQGGMVTEGKVTALEGVNDSTGILRLKAQAGPSDPSADYGFFWMDTSYSIHFKAKDSGGTIISSYIPSSSSAGVSTTFTNGDGATVTVENGIITSIV